MKPTKVILWSTPRSMSTALTKWLSFVHNSSIWFEPYMGAMYYGPEATCMPHSSTPLDGKRATGEDQETQARRIQLPEGVGYDVTKSTYQWCKEQLEADYPGKSLVFVKEISCAMTTRYDVIPRGYKHSFLIRNPLKVLPSWKKCHYLHEMDGPYEEYSIKDSKIPTSGYFFKDSYDLYQHICENFDPNPIVLDADDLLMNPAKMLKAYCNAMGIPYTDDLLHWEPSDKITMTWNVRRILLQLNQLDSWTNVDTALRSSEFLIPSSKGPSRDDLSEDDRRCVDFCMPYYNQLYEKRLLC